MGGQVGGINKTPVPSTFVFTSKGLKPSTKHFFYIEGTNFSNSCQQIGKLLGDPLISDANGAISFLFYFMKNSYGTTTNLQFYLLNLTLQSKIKVAELKSSDNTSYASTTLTVTKKNSV